MRRILPAALVLWALGAVGALALPAAPERVQRDTRTIIDVVERSVGRASTWRAPVLIEHGIGGALVTWRGVIHIDERGLDQEVEADRRYGVDALITHEVMHTVSAGVTPGDFSQWIGWEEGVAEGMRRVIQPEVFRALGYSPEGTRYALGAIGDTPDTPRDSVMYGTYLNRLERARGILALDALTFYRTLIRTPVRHRRFVVRAWAAQRPDLSPVDRRFIRRFVSPLSVMTLERYT